MHHIKNWKFPSLNALKRKVLKYLLDRYLGHFFENKLVCDQVNVDFFKGTGTVTDLTLNSQACNEVLESKGLNVEVVGGRIDSIGVIVPWHALMVENTHFEISNLCVTLRPISRQKDGSSVSDSMWSSMTSSMQIVKECMEKEEIPDADHEQKVMEGMEIVAQTIDNVINRIKARLTDTEIRLEYVTPGSNKGVVLTIKIKKIEYRNEAGGDQPEDQTFEKEEGDKNVFTFATYATHSFKMEGITFYTEEFRIESADTKKMCESSKRKLTQRHLLVDVRPRPISVVKANKRINNEAIVYAH